MRGFRVMESELIIKLITVIFMSAVKFLFAPGLALLYQLTYWQSVLFMIVGGIIGSIVFVYGSERILIFWRKITNAKPKPLFSKKSRRYVSMWKKFGAPGIAVISPIISIPVAGFLMARFGVQFKVAIQYMVLSLIVWAFILNLIVQKFGSFI
jgi:hypothetical protein